MSDVHAHVIAERSPQVVASERSFTQSANLKVNLQPLNRSLERHVDYYVRIFNIANRTFEVDRPLFKGRRGNSALPACPADKPYVEVARFPNVVIETVVHAESGQVSKQEYAGEIVAMDVICPAIVSGNQDEELSDYAKQMGAETEDLRIRGLFISTNEVPTKVELDKARSRMEKFYRQLIISAETKARAGNIGGITIEEHAAADYFGHRASWHLVAERPTLCENCGEPVQATAAFHSTQYGMCVRDWKRTVEAGVKTRQDVPIEKRWWGKNATDQE